MDNKNIAYVKEPTFLSPMDVHFRICTNNRLVREMPRLRINEDLGNGDTLSDKKSGYTLKRKK